MSHRRSHPSAGVVEDLDLGASTGLGNEFDIVVINPSTLATTKLFRFLDSGVLNIAGVAAGLTIAAFGAGVVHASSAGVFSSSLVVDADVHDVAWGKLTGAPTTLAGFGITDAVVSSRNLTAGAGLTGGGTLAADRTFAVGANADGSIAVNADDIQVGILATDAQHGTRGGGTLHAAVTNAAAGFAPAISAANRVLLSTSGTAAVWAQVADAQISGVAWSKVSGAPTTLTGYGITDAVPAGRTLTGTAPITIAGDNSPHDLSANRTIAIATATTGALGAIQLAGDLAGTGTAPTVVGLTGASGVVAVHGASLVWDVGSALSGAVGVVIKQADRNFAGSTAASTHVSAQNNTGSASTGGSYIIDAGTGIGNASGVVMLRSDSTLAGGGIGVFAIGSNALTMLNTSSLSLSDGFANLVATLTPVYNGQTELTFASTVERFDIDFVDGSVPDGSAADIHITAQNNSDLSTGIGGSVFVGSGTGALSGSVELLAGGTTRIKADKNGLGFFGTTPVARSAAYSIAHHTPLRAIDEGAPTLGTVAQLLGTVVSDLVALGLLQ